MNLVWFRNDLRVHDNPALHAAASCGPVLGCYLLAPDQWRKHGMAAARVDFLLRSLRSLSDELARLNIPLLVLEAGLFADAAPGLAALARQYRVGAVFWNDEYPLDESRRDDAVQGRLSVAGVRVQRYHDRVIAPPGMVVKNDGAPYRVFTPFKRAWLQLAEAGLPDILPAPQTQAPVAVAASVIPDCITGFATPLAPDRWPAGELEAQRRLRTFVEDRLENYHQQRDFPGLAGTSELSPYLAVGAVSPQQCLYEALRSRQQGKREGVDCWVSELAWRDFYQHLVVAFPDLCRGRPFKPETDNVPWRYDAEDFRKWSLGETGIPIVDAGMRQLLACGWMHNRVRMITAMFLTKNLLIDWRLGEAFFMAQLVDGDFAANNGGWQWSASTGTDAVPYFRIFNPFSQAARFDSRGDYIRRFVPQLRSVDARDLHDPRRLAKARPPAYPAPMVDLGHSRAAAIAAFKSVG